MKVLVTGGCGFIGANFLHYVLDESLVSKAVCLDLLTYAGNLANITNLKGDSRFEFVKGDIADGKLLSDLIREYKFDAVLNFAAESHVDRSIEDGEVFVRTNVIGTQAIIDACRSHGVSRLLQVSTDEVYGSLGDEGLFYEDTPLDPSSPYSASKAGADLLCLAANKTFGQDVVITRCTNNYGPYQFPEKLIPLFLTRLFENKKVPVYGDGKNVRSWIHVRDHCRAIFAVLEKGRSGEVYNVGSGPASELKNIDLTRTILAELGLGESHIEYVEDRLGHDLRYAVCSDKIEAELGWKPQVSFEDGLRETIEWYRENAQWCSDIKSGEYAKCQW